jgi:hypothetical protein
MQMQQPQATLQDRSSPKPFRATATGRAPPRITTT